ncbi:MAG: efflux RND transporter periplasmic adaptor subunit [Bacteroidia bacterium]|nr:efflux RND transporter periplasmic adaptor subunit [Bacteroidia bacterium]
MKKHIVITVISALIASCGAPDQKAELEKLKKQKAEIEAKILAIEEVIAKTDTGAVEKKIDVRAMALVPSIFKAYIEIQGKVDADENVSLSTSIPGTVTKINVKVGEEVSKGQVLAETDANALNQQMNDLQVNLDLAKQVLEKQSNLWAQKIGTEIQYLQAKTTKESLEKKMAALQEQLRMTKIVSPIDGTVDGVNIKIGQTVAPGLPAINVINFANLKVKADVSESYAARVKTGNDVIVLFPDLKDTVVSKINYAARAINPLTRTFNVEVKLDNNPSYHPNMVAKIKINDYQSAKPEIVVPIKYIQKSTSENFVFIAENNKVVKRVIKINREYSGSAEVTEGLKEGDLLITDGFDLVNEGDNILINK